MTCFVKQRVDFDLAFQAVSPGEFISCEQL